jgi:phosphoenolpyruvate-protein phosphotransferase (PTS system enzyme I)
MKIKKGIGVSPGVAISPAVVMDTEEFDIPVRHVPMDRAQAELARFRKAADVSKKEVLDLRDRTVERIGQEAASIFDFHLALMQDPVLHQKLSDTILGGSVSAEYAVSTVLRSYAKEFLAMPQYLSERVKDVYDIEKRFLRNLTGQAHQSLAHLSQDVVVLAGDLTPSQTASMDRAHVKGLATDAGGRTSHTAIVARALGLPAVVGLNDVTTDVAAGDTVIIDGNRGVVVIDPDPETLRNYERYARQQVEFAHSLDALRDLPAVTRDGHEVTILGNIEFPSEAAAVLAKGGQGIGLYRTEFLYLSGDVEPAEEDQYRAYRQVIDACHGLPVVIRTLDLGADKYTQSRARAPERNPMLGCRSIRFCLQNISMFKRQVRAILRAAAGDTHVSMLFPLISGMMELRQAKAVVRDVLEDLEEEDIEHNPDVPVGIMVETPSAAILCDVLAREVDFYSIGTNDLIQYTLAVDRGNERVANLYSAAHPAVLRLIRQVIRSGIRFDVPVSMCGEMAGDPLFTLPLLGMGLKTFSCAPSSAPIIKQVIRSATMEQALLVGRKVMLLESENEVANYLRSELRQVLPTAMGD